MIALAFATLVFGQPTTELTSADLFNPDVLQRIDLHVNSIDWAKLKQNFQENIYYPADVVWKGQTVRNTGIRSRGAGSRSGTKPGLRVDFARYASNQTFLGLKSIVLDNLTQDPSGIHETVAMRVFERLGVRAPREAHARLFVNGEYAGLYAVVESIDKRFLARVFGSIDEDVQNDGYLYEFEFIDGWQFGYLGSALPPYKARFDPKTHESAPDEELFRPIETLVRLVNEAPVEHLIDGVGAYLDLPGFMRYVAIQNFIGENDGVLGRWGMNNFYLYRLERSNRHLLIPWDADHSFWGPEFPITTHHETNVLMQKAMQVPELRSLYYATLRECMALTEVTTGPDRLGWLEYEVRRQADMIYNALREDGAKPFTIEAHEAARIAMIIFARERARYVSAELQIAQLSRRR